MNIAILSSALRTTRVKSKHLYVTCGSITSVLTPRPTQHRSYDPKKMNAFDWSGKYRNATKKFKNTEFESKVVNQDFPVIVNFHAEWCDPCHEVVHMLKRCVEKSEYVCSVTLVVEENPEIVQHLAVTAVPTLIAFHQGYQVKKYVGSVTEEEVKRLVARLDNAFRKRVLMFHKQTEKTPEFKEPLYAEEKTN